MNVINRDVIACYMRGLGGRMSEVRRRFRTDGEYIFEVSYKTGRRLRYGLVFDVEPNQYIDETLLDHNYNVVATCPKNCRM